ARRFQRGGQTEPRPRRGLGQDDRGQPPPRPDEGLRYLAAVRSVSTDYLETLGVPLVRGRRLDSRDAADAPLAAVVDETMAEVRWPGQHPIGRRFKIAGPNSEWVTVVGVVGTVRQMGLDEAPYPAIYVPMMQLRADSFMWPRYLVVRTEGDPLALATAVRRAVWNVDPDQPVNIRTMSDVVDDQLANRSTQLTLLAGFAALALLLAAIGLYGVLSYSVARRTSEIGLRMALGAERASVVGSIVGNALLMAVFGLVLGLAASFALSRLLASFLFGVTPTDPATFAAAAAALVLVALLASYVPARRAAEVDPATALRTE
ncbi:MAG TPA: FtsX-like permease family protein, partial [Gammaproteobacteria bacterium]|nr:FtsX-like permease family protein [Gammaproteobacteria bacterium]